MRLEGTPSGKRNAKRLRQEMTPPEIALWLALKANDAGLRFSASDVLSNLDGVVRRIEEVALARRIRNTGDLYRPLRRSAPPPPGGGG